MTKQRRGPERSAADASAERRAAGRRADQDADRALALGNAAQAALVASEPVALDVARDVALPMVEHARLALTVQHEVQTPRARLQAIVASSALAPDMVAWLGERLESGARIERAVQATLGKCWPGQTLAEVDAVLENVASGLARGQAAGDAWSVDGVSLAVAPSHSVGDAVDRLVAALAGGEHAQPVVALVRQLHLAVMLDEEEEEDLMADFGVPDVG